MDLQALKNEITLDPKGLGYATYLPDAPGMVMQLLNSLSDTMIKPLRTTTAKAWAAAGPYAKIVDASNDVASPVRSSCLILRDTLISGDEIHMEMPDIKTMFGAWVLFGIITQAQHDDLFLRATQPASRAEVLGLVGATEYDLQIALELP